MKYKNIIKKALAVFGVVLCLITAVILPSSAVGLNDQNDYIGEKFPDMVTDIYNGLEIYPNIQWTNESYGFRAYLGSNSGEFYGMTNDKVEVYERHVIPRNGIYYDDEGDGNKNDLLIQWEVTYNNQPDRFHFDQTAPESTWYEGLEGYVISLRLYNVRDCLGDNGGVELFNRPDGNNTYYGFRFVNVANCNISYRIVVEGITSVLDDDDIPLPMPSYDSGLWSLNLNDVDEFINHYYNKGYEKGSAELEKKVAEAWQKGYNAGYSQSSDGGNFNLYKLLTTVAVAPVTFVKEAFNFDVFGVNLANFFTMLMTLALIALAVVLIIKAVK